MYGICEILKEEKKLSVHKEGSLKATAAFWGKKISIVSVFSYQRKKLKLATFFQKIHFAYPHVLNLERKKYIYIHIKTTVKPLAYRALKQNTRTVPARAARLNLIGTLSLSIEEKQR